MKKNFYLLITALVVFVAAAEAQSGGLLLYNMERVPQSNQMNPAQFPTDTKMFFSLPSFDFAVEFPFSYSDAITRGRDDSLRLDPAHFLSKLYSKNKIQLSLNTQLLGFGIKIKDSLIITFSTSVRSSFNFNFSKDLINFAVHGNEPYLGKTASLINNGVGGASAWAEYAIGAGYKINEKLSVGGKLKLLSGIMNISTKGSNLSLYTSPTGDMLRANCHVNIRTSVPENASFSSVAFGKNKGFGVDFGGTYSINKMFDVAASVVDLGFINWKDNTTAYRSSENSREFEFRGFEWDDLWKDGEFNSDFFTNFTDTLKSIISLDTIENMGAYRTMTPAKIFLSGGYRINNLFKVNAVYRMLFAEKSMYSAFALSAHYYSGKWFEASVGNTIIGKSFFNPGLAMNVSLGGVFQIFGAVDFSSLQLAKARTFNAQVGINLMF